MLLPRPTYLGVVCLLAFFFGISLAQDYPDCPEPDKVCDSWGIDFMSDGTYFQDTNSQDPFTFVEQFTGCQPDTALNFLVDPNGNQYECSNVTITPDGENKASTCQINKSQLTSGQYSILILSNNGQCQPIANQRDFTIAAGAAQTRIITPTVSFTTTTTPMSKTSTLTAPPPYTTTMPSSSFTPTTTTTPPPVTSTKVIRLLTLTIVKYRLKVVPKWVTKTTACSATSAMAALASTPMEPDPVAKILPTIQPEVLQSTVGDAMDMLTSRLDDGGLLDAILVRRKQATSPERNAHARKLRKRAPDETMSTIMETDTAKFITSTSVVTASPVTQTLQTYRTITCTETPPPVTAYSGVTTVSPDVVTAPAWTKTKTKYTVDIVFSTKTLTTSPTITTTVAPKEC
ncbi:MAG: hypothetical protein M1831_005394 [Alyxoria varia]|nr:MAG: hypothetical protein M1831_005394 [Alyxoria varia]